MSSPQKLLALEASTRARSVALFVGGDCVAERFEYDPKRHHSERLLAMLDRALNEAGFGLDALDLVVASAGPGSFTSVRIGLATAQGLAFAAEKPIYALSTLQVLAAAVPAHAGAILPMLDARKGEVYSVCYPDCPATAECEPLLPAAVDRAEAWVTRAAKACGGPLVCVGDGALAYREALVNAGGRRVVIFDEPDLIHPKARVLGGLALARIAAELPLLPPHPLYLRKPEAVVNLEKKASA